MPSAAFSSAELSLISHFYFYFYFYCLPPLLESPPPLLSMAALLRRSTRSALRPAVESPRSCSIFLSSTTFSSLRESLFLMSFGADGGDLVGGGEVEVMEEVLEGCCSAEAVAEAVAGGRSALRAA